MKLIIDLPEEVVTAIQNGEDYRYDIHTAIAQGIPYEPKGDLISREALKKALNYIYDCAYIDSKSKEGIASDIIATIDNAPTVAVNCKDCDGYEAGYSAGLKDAERPIGEWVLKPMWENPISTQTEFFIPADNGGVTPV